MITYCISPRSKRLKNRFIFINDEATLQIYTHNAFKIDVHDLPLPRLYSSVSVCPPAGGATQQLSLVCSTGRRSIQVTWEKRTTSEQQSFIQVSEPSFTQRVQCVQDKTLSRSSVRHLRLFQFSSFTVFDSKYNLSSLR